MKRLTALSLVLATAGMIVGVALATPSAPTPSQLCKTERASADFATTHSGKTFAQHYGTNRNNANAFGKCVAAKAKAQAKTETTSTASTQTAQTETQSAPASDAEKACTAERADANFAAAHGGKISRSSTARMRASRTRSASASPARQGRPSRTSKEQPEPRRSRYAGGGARRRLPARPQSGNEARFRTSA